MSTNRGGIEEVMDDFMQSLGMPGPEKTIGITGRRRCENIGYVQRTLNNTLWYFINKGKTHVIVGGALGTDTFAANEILMLRKEIAASKELVLTLAIPFPDFTSMWSEYHKKEFHRIWRRADYTFCLGSKGYAPIKYRVRNEYIVSNSSMLIAVWEGKESGGTYHTIKTARELGVPIFRICPKLKRKGWLK